MTLILSAVTPHYVVQVSDRRVTFVRNREVFVGDCRANKAVIYGNRITFGYTGLASLAGLETHWWLTAILSKLPKETSLADALKHIAQQAESAVCAAPVHPWKRYLAFCGVGWTSREDSTDLNGSFYAVSNFHDESGRRLIVPQRQFSIISQTLHGSQCSYYVLGAELNENERRWLRRDYKACIKRGVGPVPIIRLFTMVIRSVASRDQTVGKELMLTLLPKRAAESGMVILRCGNFSMPLSLGAKYQAMMAEATKVGPECVNQMLQQILDAHTAESMYFAYSPPDSSVHIAFAPAIVDPGGVTLGELTVAIGENSHQEVLNAYKKFGITEEIADRCKVEIPLPPGFKLNPPNLFDARPTALEKP